MLSISIINDQTSDLPLIVGNYDYIISINEKIVKRGRIEDHNRLTG